MRRTILLFLMLLILNPSMPAHAQSGQTWEDGCDERARTAIASTTEVLNYDTACNHYRMCDPNGDGDMVCQFKTFKYMLDQCPLDDEVCRNGAILFAAAIIMYDAPLGESSGWSPPQSVIDNVPIALEAYWRGDYQAALDAYSQTSPEDYSFDAMLPLSRAILYQLLDQPDAALAEYPIIFAFTFEQPLVWYARSQLYAELERTDEASFDIAALSAALTHEAELESFVLSLQVQYPLADNVTDWILFPLTGRSDGPGGNYTTDLSDSSPRIVKVGLYPELNTLVTIGLQNWSANSGFSEPTWRLFLLTGDDDQTYSIRYPEYWDNAGQLSITFDENGMAHGTEYIQFFEGLGEWNFVLMPIEAIDPRSGLSDRIRHCEGGVLSRVEIGMQYESVSYAYGLAIADAPAGSTISELNYDDSIVTVIDGPVCVDQVAWWQVSYANEATGWVAENEGHTYMIRPVGAE